MKKLTEGITQESFDYVKLGLFEKHKIIFSAYLALKILEKDSVIKKDEVAHFIQGKVYHNNVSMSEQLKSFLTEQIFKDLKSFEYIPELSEICENLESDLIYWRKWFGEEKVEEIELPKKFKDVTDFHRLMII